MLALPPASCGCGDGAGGCGDSAVVIVLWCGCGAGGVDVARVVWRTQHKVIHTQRWRDRRGALQESWNNNLLSDSSQALPLYLSI